jgi:hypothetical protein
MGTSCTTNFNRFLGLSALDSNADAIGLRESTCRKHFRVFLVSKMNLIHRLLCGSVVHVKAVLSALTIDRIRR